MVFVWPRCSDLPVRCSRITRSCPKVPRAGAAAKALAVLEVKAVVPVSAAVISLAVARVRAAQGLREPALG
jgi:hypothetical protein